MEESYYIYSVSLGWVCVKGIGMASFIGIDIGSDAIKLVEFKKTRRSLVLKKAAYLPYRDIPVFEDMSPKDREAEALRWVLAQNDIKKAQAIISLPAGDIYSKYIELPPVTADKVDQIVHFEARQQIPFPLEDVSWDYHLIGSDRSTAQAYVVLHAIKEPVVYEFTNNIDSTQIHIQTLDVPSMALYNLASYNQIPVGSMVVDIGEQQTTLLIVDDKGFWTRTIPVAGKHLTQLLAERMGTGEGPAIQFKHSVGLQGEGSDFQRSQMLEEGLEEVVGEIKKTLQHYISLESAFVLQKLYLTGGNMRILGAVDLFANRFDAEVELLDPFQRVDIASDVGHDQAQNMRYFFAIATGLALRHVSLCPVQVNLLPHGVQKDRYYRRVSLVMVMWAVLISCFWGLYLNQGQAKLVELRTQTVLAQKESNAFRQMEKTIVKISNEIAPLETQLRAFAKVSRERSRLLDWLLDIKKVTINDMFYSMFHYGFTAQEMQILRDLRQKRFDEQKVRQHRLKPQKDETFLLRPNDLFIKGVTSDSYKKVDGLKIAMESYSYVSTVSVDYAKEGVKDERTKIMYTMKVKIKES